MKTPTLAPSAPSCGKTQHTPGPWVIECGVVKSADGSNISGIVPARCKSENLHLIAAAPALLSALESIQPVLINCAAKYEANGRMTRPDVAVLRKYAAELRAAIASARGEPAEGEG